MDSKFPIKGRYIVAVWLIPFLYLPGINEIYTLIQADSEWYWYDITYYYYFHFISAAVLVILVISSKVSWSSMFRRPLNADFQPAIKLTVFIFIFSIAAAFALFYPLSYMIPEFVNYWFIELPPIIYTSQGQYPFLPNLLSFLSLVILAPVIEEFTFRGVLLHRWSEKWGTLNAILISSLLFGILHPDPIGAAAFGIAMCVIYMKTQTLIVPIICHGLNNLVVWFMEVGYVIWLGPDYSYTLEEFQAEWTIGLSAAAISAVWVYVYLQGKQSQKGLTLPKI